MDYMSGIGDLPDQYTNVYHGRQIRLSQPIWIKTITTIGFSRFGGVSLVSYIIYDYILVINKTSLCIKIYIIHRQRYNKR